MGRILERHLHGLARRQRNSPHVLRTEAPLVASVPIAADDFECFFPVVTQAVHNFPALPES